MVKKVLVLGAGRSVTSLILSLNQLAIDHELEVTLADQEYELTVKKSQSLSHVSPLSFKTDDEELLIRTISTHDVVISMLPPSAHLKIAIQCIRLKKHLITASYLSEKLRSYDQKAKDAGILILMEAGLDPGIDHMSAMKELNEIRSMGGKITSFKSYTGGVIAPESDDNPWHYKITWNPKNVVMAGREGARFISNGQYKFIPYHSVFSRLDKVFIPEYGEYLSLIHI